MQVTAFLFAALLIGIVAAQPTPTSTPTPTPGGYDVTMRECLGAECNQACFGMTFPGGVCHQSHRNASEFEALWCHDGGVCLNMQIYMMHGCDGPTFETRRISGQCDGSDRDPARWSSFNYLNNSKLQINWNCSSDCISNCEVAGIVDITTCWDLGRISGTLDYMGPCRWINADRFENTCSRTTLLSRVSIEEGSCFVEGIRSSMFTCEGAPPPPSQAPKRRVVKYVKKV